MGYAKPRFIWDDGAGNEVALLSLDPAGMTSLQISDEFDKITNATWPNKDIDILDHWDKDAIWGALPVTFAPLIWSMILAWAKQMHEVRVITITDP